MSEREEYLHAMMKNDVAAALAIERRHNLDGYPPNVVSACLCLIEEEGISGLEAADRIIGGEE